MQHTIKIKNCFYNRIQEWKKTWELRKNDRDYKVWDTIVFDLFEQWLICNTEFIITYVLQWFDWLEEWYCIFSIESEAKYEKQRKYVLRNKK